MLSWVSLLRSLFGVFSIIIIGVFFSVDSKKIEWRKQCKIFSLLLLMAFFLLKFSIGVYFIKIIANIFVNLYGSAEKGIQFLFGSLSDFSGPWGFIFAFRVIPVIIFFSALIAALNFLGWIEKAVTFVGKIVSPLMGTRKAETLCAIANSFLGQTEAPILIKDYLSAMSDSEIFAVMVSGMGTISGALIAVYGVLGVSINHLLISSFLSIPATLFVAKLWVPLEDNSFKEDTTKKSIQKKDFNILDAIAQGTFEGLSLALNIGAILLVTISLLGLIDSLFSCFYTFISTSIGLSVNQYFFSLKNIFSILGIPAAWVIGISKEGLYFAASLIGTKITVNEMLAYSNLFHFKFCERDTILLTYALCGFSNFSCIGIQIGGISVLAPEKRSVISKYGFKAVFAAACSNILVACIVNLII